MSDAPSITGTRLDFASDQAHRITIDPVASSDGRWSRFPHDLHDEEIVAQLSDPGLRVLTAFLRLSDPITGALDPRTGLVFAEPERLMAVTRRGRTLVYKGRAELLSWRPRHGGDHRRLAIEREKHRYAVLFGWAYAGRPQVRTEPAKPSADADRKSASADAPCVPHREARARFENKTENSEDNNSRAAVVVQVLLGAGIGFTQLEASSLAGIEDVTEAMATNALEGAKRVRRAGKLKISKHRDADACMRAWITMALHHKWNLFDQAAADRHSAQATARAKPGLIEKLRDKVRPALSEGDADFVLSRLGGWDRALDEVAKVVPAWPHSSPARIREVLVGCANQTPDGPFEHIGPR